MEGRIGSLKQRLQERMYEFRGQLPAGSDSEQPKEESGDGE
jgi:hypothetical protein